MFLEFFPSIRRTLHIFIIISLVSCPQFFYSQQILVNEKVSVYQNAWVCWCISNLKWTFLLSTLTLTLIKINLEIFSKHFSIEEYEGLNLHEVKTDFKIMSF